MEYSSDFKNYTKANKYSQSQVDLTKSLAKKYNLSNIDIINLQAELGRFISEKIQEDNWQIIYFANLGKWLPILQKQLKGGFVKQEYSKNTQEEKGYDFEDI